MGYITLVPVTFGVHCGSDGVYTRRANIDRISARVYSDSPVYIYTLK